MKSGLGRDLVFIDGQFKCAPTSYHYDVDDPRSFRKDERRWSSEIFWWEWASEPDGLEYLAARLRQACGLEESTGSRPLPTDASQAPLMGSEDVEPEATAMNPVVEVVLWTAFFALGPLFIAAGAAGDAAQNAALNSVDAHLARITLPIAADSLAVQLGSPEGQFEWPRVSTTIYFYDLVSSHPCYVGVVNGEAVWMHGEYPWLRRQAEQAAEAAK